MKSSFLFFWSSLFFFLNPFAYSFESPLLVWRISLEGEPLIYENDKDEGIDM